jgi:hypothetical protein
LVAIVLSVENLTDTTNYRHMALIAISEQRAEGAAQQKPGKTGIMIIR